MGTYEYELDEAPDDARALELWMQHAAGFIFFEDVRGYALRELDPALSPEARASAEKGINDALYGLMMVIDGVSGAIRNGRHLVDIGVSVRLRRAGDPNHVIAEVDLQEGDGMCMGYHGWLENDFGEDPIVRPRKAPD